MHSNIMLHNITQFCNIVSFLFLLALSSLSLSLSFAKYAQTTAGAPLAGILLTHYGCVSFTSPVTCQHLRDRRLLPQSMPQEHASHLGPCYGG